MGCIGLLLPILGVFGYANQIWWLFYLAGGIAAVFDIIALTSGELRCFGTIVTMVFWYYAYRLTGSFWDGFVLGSCLSTIVIVIVSFILEVFTIGIVAAIAGLTSLFDWLKNIRK